MPGTMDKKDVKIAYKDPKAVKWDKIQQCSGVLIPSLAKKAVADAMENKKYKKLTVKVGLIKTDLFLRIKNGNDHVQDVKLVQNWKAPKTWVDEAVDDVSDDGSESSDDGGQGQQDPQYQPKLKAWKQDKEDTKKLGEQVVVALQNLIKEADLVADRAEVEAERVAEGKDTMNDALPKATERLQKVQELNQEADTVFQRYFVQFDRHRSGEKGEDFKQEDKEGYGVSFFMEKLKPLFQKAQFLKDAVANYVTKAQTAVNFITTHKQQGPAQAFLVQAQAFRQRQTELLDKSKKVLGAITGDIAQVLEAMAKDQENVTSSKTQDMKLARADQSLQRLVGIREAKPRMTDYLNESQSLLKEVGAKIPKPLWKDGVIGPEVNAFTVSFKEMATYHAGWHKQAGKAEDVYKATLKLVNKS